MSRRALQILNGAVALATVVLGGSQLVLGTGSPVYHDLSLPAAPVLDSNLRFFGGLGLALGLLLAWVVPRIERRTGAYRIFWSSAFLGGLGRLLSIAQVGAPSGLLVGITVLEVAGAPIFLAWQRRVAVEPGPAGR